jgi:hypothetical protein
MSDESNIPPGGDCKTNRNHLRHLQQKLTRQLFHDLPAVQRRSSVILKQFVFPKVCDAARECTESLHCFLESATGQTSMRFSLYTFLRTGWFQLGYLTMIRKRSKPHTFEEQLSAYAARLKAEVAELPDGFQKDNLLEKVRQLEAASTMNDWLAPSR